MRLSWFLPLVLVATSLMVPVAHGAAPANVKDGRALPAIPGLVRSLLANQQEVESIRKNYIFTMEEDEQEPDGHGGLRTKHHNVYEVQYSGPWLVQTLVAQDGRRLSAAEIQRDSDKDMRRARSGMLKLESDPQAEGNDGLRLSDFLAADQFVNLRREKFRGRQVLVLDFVPNPSYKPQRAVQKILKNLNGKIYIDEQELRGIRLEAHVTNNVNYGGFLASVRKGTAVVFEQQKINDEIWLPSYTELHFDARELFSTKHINIVHRFSNYKRFRVETAIVPF